MSIDPMGTGDALLPRVRSVEGDGEEVGSRLTSCCLGGGRGRREGGDGVRLRLFWARPLD